MSRRILIVEDEMIIAENMRLMIKELGEYGVPQIAGTPSEAQQQIAEAVPDLVLLDIRMGEKMDGIDFSDHLNQLGIPFIYVTSHGDPSTISRAVVTNPCGYLIKPVSTQALNAQLQLAFSRIDAECFYSFRAGTHDVRIAEKDILFVKSDNVYSEIHTINDRFIVRKSTKAIIDELKRPLLQVHRSCYVNPVFVKEVNAVVRLTSGHELPLSRGFKDQVVQTVFK